MAFLGGGRLVIAAAGTQKNLAQGTGDAQPNLPIDRIVVTPFTANTAPVAIGGPNTRATVGSESGALVAPGGSLTVVADDLSDVWVDARVSGEGVSFAFVTGR